jgi:ferric-dicitrate binding protein FerR (iron transport regulator)
MVLTALVVAPNRHRTRALGWALGVLGLALALPAAEAASARVTQAYGEVTIGGQANGKSARPASTGDTVRDAEYVRTAMKSRAELQFPDKTLLRVGSSTVFTFNSGPNQFRLAQGEGLLVFPKGQGGAKVSTAGLTAAILGTTIYVTSRPGEFTYACLEGRCTVGPHTLGPGEKIVLKGSAAPYSAPKRTFNLKKFLRSNPLVANFKNPLPSQSLIEREAAKQSRP